MKKLLALLIVGGLLGLTTGCPSESSTKPAAPPPKGTSPDKGMPPDKGPKDTLPGKGPDIDKGAGKGTEPGKGGPGKKD